MAYFNVVNADSNDILLDGLEYPKKEVHLTKDSSGSELVEDTGGTTLSNLNTFFLDDWMVANGNVLYIEREIADIYDSWPDSEDFLEINQIMDFPQECYDPYHEETAIWTPSNCCYTRCMYNYRPMGGFMISFNDKIYIYSSYYDDEEYNDRHKFYILNPVEYLDRNFPNEIKTEIIELSPPPEILVDCDAVVWDGKIHVVGFAKGASSSTPLYQRIRHYEYDGSTWAQSFDLDIDSITTQKVLLVNFKERFHKIVDGYIYTYVQSQSPNYWGSPVDLRKSVVYQGTTYYLNPRRAVSDGENYTYLLYSENYYGDQVKSLITAYEHAMSSGQPINRILVESDDTRWHSIGLYLDTIYYTSEHEVHEVATYYTLN